MSIKKTSIFVKIAIASMAGLVLSALGMVVFVLMPIYGLVGSNIAGSNTTDANQTLDGADTKVHVILGVMVLLIVILVVAVAIAVWQQLQHNRHDG